MGIQVDRRFREPRDKQRTMVVDSPTWRNENNNELMSILPGGDMNALLRRPCKDATVELHPGDWSGAKLLRALCFGMPHGRS